jgi:hypothetical protein
MLWINPLNLQRWPLALNNRSRSWVKLKSERQAGADRHIGGNREDDSGKDIGKHAPVG